MWPTANHPAPVRRAPRTTPIAASRLVQPRRATSASATGSPARATTRDAARSTDSARTRAASASAVTCTGMSIAASRRQRFLHRSILMPQRPLIVLVDHRPRGLSALLDAIARRYGADYRVTAHLTADAALEELARTRHEGEPVALVIADQWMPEMTG